MSLPKAIQSVELGDGIGPNDLSGAPRLSECHKTLVEPEEEEEEEEDIDFNPLLKESPSEASSSLSSEVEGWDANVDSDGENSPHTVSVLSPMQSAVTKTSPASGSDHCKRMILHSENSNEAQGREVEDIGINNKRSKVVTVSNPENIDIGVKETGSGSGTDVVTDALDADVDTSKKCINDIDEEDAICRRTRARYSLASFSLDELETFLQGTDDEDDFQNVDEEEEYRKFLSAVLQGGDGADPATLDNGNDEDEDNDADFEIEIEEALESDPEDCLMVSKQKDKGVGRCPETRRNKHQKVPLQSENSPGQPKRTLRPLLPILPNGPIVSCPGINNRYMTPNATQFLPSRHDSVTNGFTPHQIGQLYCLIHEHVQLLIQVYSLCVLEPSRQHIASQVQGFIEDMIEKRNQALNQRNVHYPSFCFGQPYAHQSASDDGIVESSETTDDHRVLSSTTDRLQGSSSCGKISEHASMGHVNSVQASQGCGWLPSIGSAVVSVLDVAPLKLVGRYIDDVSTAVREHQRRYVEAASSINLIKEPLFPLPAPPSTSQVHNVATEESNLLQSNVVPSSSPNQKPPKKSLAATLVENTKKQSVALVPKEIAKLAQQFYPFFNPTLFPHKPPPSSVAKRVLFTDAEDELLALGMMEYNNDWKAIQQRFLPCKSKHQIFVRAKNRCSAKAPENPIKAVRRMKTSPLNPDEIARIHEGLKVFKLDWMSIWKFIVPYRDLSLLPRQWRVALGTQKSYKMDSAKKESRRIYESKRRRKIAALGSLQVASKTTEIVEENDSREDCLDNEDGAYVHEAFLADWRPASSSPIDSENCSPILGSRCSGNQTNQESQPERGSRHKFASDVCREPDSHPVPYRSSDSFHGVPSCPASVPTLKPSKYRASRMKSSHLVRLAPDLPPVNLPPSVRVISHVAFRSSQNGGSTVIAPARFSTSGDGMGTAASGPSPSLRPSPCASKQKSNANISPLCSQDYGSQKNMCVPEENGSTADLQMHPLLFQTPNHRSLPHCSVISSNSPSSFSFFPTTSHQINISPFGNPDTGDLSIDSSYNPFQPKEDVSPSGLDFHPLLRRTVDFNCKSIAAGPTAQVSADLAARDTDGEAQTLAHTTEQINAQSAASAGTTSPKSNRNDLNLEFNLSSVPLEEKSSSNNQTEVLELSNNFGSCATIGDNNHSMPEIVMEQEELSDSDDEIEDVEFECEEMADSEGDEGSDSEYNAIEQNELKQEKPDHTVGASRFVSKSTACEDPEGIPAQSKDTSSRTLDLCGPEKDSATSPWLSLSSHAL